MDQIEAIERWIILLLGVVDTRPIPSETHLQKELFLLSKSSPKISELIRFDKHHFGPYSVDLDDVSKNPVFLSDTYALDSENKKIFITPRGVEVYERMVSEYGDQAKFSQLMAMMRMVRDLYDRLSTDELLFLIYVTYEEFTERSWKSMELLSEPKRSMLAKRLLRKGVITSKRFDEIIASQ
jgi:uncharacterized protein YwgA